MTRKDYLKAAAIVQDEAKKDINAAALMQAGFIRLFTDDNPKFNRDRFVKACSLENEE